jgi:hypothetical protein
MVTITIVLLYQNANLKDNLNANLQSVVDQVNDSTMYAYKFDKNQDANIKNLDNNLKIVQDNLLNVSHNVKLMQSQVANTVNNSDVFLTKNLKTNKINLGQTHSILAPGNDGWVRINNPAGTDLYGGLAAANLYVTNKATFAAAADVSALNVLGTSTFKGGKSTFNPQGLATHFPYSDGTNYIRGDTEIRGNTTNIGDLKTNTKLCIGNTCVTEAQLARIKQVTES